jgi:outer membrane protein assembly factor BamB
VKRLSVLSGEHESMNTIRETTALVLVGLLVVSAIPLAGGAWAAPSANATNASVSTANETSANETGNETDDWPQSRANAGRTGATGDEGALPYPETAWVVQYESLQGTDGFTRGGPAAAPTVANGTVYLPRWTGSYAAGHSLAIDHGHRGMIVARNATTGEVLWTRTGREETEMHGIGRATGPPAVSNGTVYVSTEDDLQSPDPDALDENGGLVALDAETGETRWKRNESWNWGPPVVTNGSVFAIENAVDSEQALTPTNHTSTLHALDPATGETQWTNENVTNLAGVAGGTVYAVNESSDTHHLIALDAETGEVRWRVELPPEADILPGAYSYGLAPIAVTPEAAYVTANPNRVIAYDAADGDRMWSRNLSSEAEWSEPVAIYAPAVVDGRVYVTTRGERDEEVSTVHTLNATTGEHEWRFETAAFLEASPSIGNRTVYVHGGFGGADLAGEDASADNVAYALNATDGAKQWGYGYSGSVRDTTRLPPVVADGMLFFSAEEKILYSSTLVAVDSTDEAPTEFRVVNDTAERPNQPPTVTVETEPADATEDQLEAGTNVTLTANASDPDGEVASIEWTVRSDGEKVTETGESITVEVSACVDLDVTVRVADDDGASTSETAQIPAGYRAVP